MKDLDGLQDALQRDLAWRKKELSSIKLSASQAAETDDHIYRSCHVLVCSHWEGFLKKSLSIYLEHIFSQEVALKQFAPFVLAIAFFKDVKDAAQANYPGSKLNHLALAEKLVPTLNAFPDRPTWKVDTEGNPGEDVLGRLISSTGLDAKLGMPDATWETTKVFINEQLLKDRNFIAHGEGVPVTREVLIERVDRLLSVLEAVLTEIMTCATSRRYIKAA